MFVSVSRVVTLAACMYIRLLLTYSFPQPEIGLALCIGMRSETLERIHVRIGINTPPRTSQYDAWDRWCSAKSRKFLYRSFTLKKCPTLQVEITKQEFSVEISVEKHTIPVVHKPTPYVLVPSPLVFCDNILAQKETYVVQPVRRQTPRPTPRTVTREVSTQTDPQPSIVTITDPKQLSTAQLYAILKRFAEKDNE